MIKPISHKNRSEREYPEVPRRLEAAFKSEDIEMEEDRIEQELFELAIPVKICGKSARALLDSEA